VTKKFLILLITIVAFGVVRIRVYAQAPTPSPSNSQNVVTPRPAPECCGYPFPRELDAEIADSDVHRVLYQDQHVMFMEVINPPLLDVHVHGHPYISVFAHDSNTGGRNPDAPAKAPGGSGPMDPKSPYNKYEGGEGAAPQGMKWPTCTTAAPQAPHRPFNSNVSPNHFFRIEFLRVEQEDFQTHWKEWYPEMAAPVEPGKELAPGPMLGPKFSEQWPYPVAFDSINAAPNNYKLLYEDGKIRLVEVTIRPGETTPMHGHPYPAVIAYNSISGNPADVTDKNLDPNSPLNGQRGGFAAAPKFYNLEAPTCGTSAPQAPHALHNGGTVPVHYYRIEFKRIDGDGLAQNWKKWYPWMQYMQYMR
jgi:hypothetical protein